MQGVKRKCSWESEDWECREDVDDSSWDECVVETLDARVQCDAMRGMEQYVREKQEFIQKSIDDAFHRKMRESSDVKEILACFFGTLDLERNVRETLASLIDAMASSTEEEQSQQTRQPQRKKIFFGKRRHF